MVLQVRPIVSHNVPLRPIGLNTPCVWPPPLHKQPRNRGERSSGTTHHIHTWSSSTLKCPLVLQGTFGSEIKRSVVHAQHGCAGAHVHVAQSNTSLTCIKTHAYVHTSTPVASWPRGRAWPSRDGFRAGGESSSGSARHAKAHLTCEKSGAEFESTLSRINA